MDREDDSDEDSLAVVPPADSTSAVSITPENRTLGRCRLRYLVAQGGMASVYLSQIGGAGGFERWVAVKVVHPHLGRDPRFSRMLLDEARITARIQHPNVRSVLDFGQEGETCFLVMEYLHGESLASVVRRAIRGKGGLPWTIACRIVLDAARGLHAAHELRDHKGKALGIVHRDISPQNLFVLFDGVSKVLDFGVAQARNKLEKTKSGEVKGKLAYMSPEQLLGQATDRRTDVWALGVVLAEALTSQRLFRGQSEGETVQRVLNHEIVRPSRTPHGAEIPRALDALVMRCLARDPATRVSSAAELADGLEDILHGASVRAGPREVADWMREVFADRRAMREAMLRQDMPAGIVPEVELETAQTVVTPGLSELNAQAPPSQRPGRRRTLETRLVVLVGVGFAMTLALGFWLGTRGRGDTREDGILPAAVEMAEPARIDVPLEREPPSAEVAAPERITPVVAATSEAVPTVRATPIDRTRRERATVATGRLNLLAVPSARVYLRGRLLGETPLMDVELPEGRHTLELRPVDGGTVRNVSIVIRAGELTRESVR